MGAHWHDTATIVFLVVFVLVIGGGAVASHFWSSGSHGLAGWGLGGRQFGTLVTWFLVGGDFYTAYTLVAVPAHIFDVGGFGFFALPYTILVYPFVFLTMPRLWTVCRVHGFITSADFVRARYGSSWLERAIALTGIVALLPYIALQLLGVEAVLSQLGMGSTSHSASMLPVFLAFAVLAAFTYTSGLRAPALIAFAKDAMIYIVVLTAAIRLPLYFGGYRHVFHAAALHYAEHGSGASVLPNPSQFSGYATLAAGSALAAFLYPHTVTSVLASASAKVIRKNAVLLPAYTFLLGLIALLGIVGAAANLHLANSKQVVPALLSACFPPWFAGFAFAAIAVAAMVPASIMSISAANLFTQNLKPQRKETAPDFDEALYAKRTSVVVNCIAFAFVLFVPTHFAVNLQLLGGIWILQTLPSVIFGLWRRMFHHVALLAGWSLGILTGTTLAAQQHLDSSITTLHAFHHSAGIYIGIVALAVNLAVTAAVSLACDALKMSRHIDSTSPDDYLSYVPVVETSGDAASNNSSSQAITA